MSTMMQTGSTMRISLRRAIGRGLVGALALAATTTLALAETPAAQAPQAPAAEKTMTQSVHDDWTVRCKGEAPKKVCEAVQTLQTPDLKNILAHVAVRAEKNGPTRLIVLVPPGVWLPANVTFSVKGVPDIVLTYKICERHCTASVMLTPEDVSALKASSGAGELVFEAGGRRKVILPISFKGLGEAMKASLDH